MRKFYLPLLLCMLFAFIQTNLNAQCAPAYTTGGTGQNYPLNIKYIQTFKASCSGQLTGVTFNFPNFADDLRYTGYFITILIQDETGATLGSITSTDANNPYPNTSKTYDFSCFNITVRQGSTYRWVLQESVGTTELILLPRYAGGTYVDGYCILDGTSYPNSDLRGWTVNINALPVLATASSSQTQNISSCGTFKSTSSELIAYVKPAASNGISGNTTAKVWVENSQPSAWVKRHYEITPATNAQTASGRVTLYFTQSDFNDFNAVSSIKLPVNESDAIGIANLLVEKRAGTSSDGSGNPLTYTGAVTTIDPVNSDIVWSSTANRWEVSFNVTGFSGFFLKTNSGPLPVTLVSFSAATEENFVKLNWKTSSELNTARFEIEKSTDARSFIKIGMLEAAGESKVQRHYSFNDSELNPSVPTYYRLRMIDFDDSFAYSKMVTVSRVPMPFDVKLYPNPVVTSTFATIHTKDAEAIVHVYNAAGREMLPAVKVQNGVAKLNTATLVNGTYIVSIAGSDGVYTRKLSVQK